MRGRVTGVEQCMGEGRPDNTRFLLWLALLTLAALCLRIYGLAGVPPSEDELQVISSATNYMEQGHFGQTMWQHPKLRNILVYWSISLFGGSIWGLKAISLSFGVASVPLVGLITRRIFNSAAAALFASFFMAIDPLHIDFSRQAVQEVYMPFFFIPAIYAALCYSDRENTLMLMLSGVFFGLGVASKWYVAFPLVVTYFFLAWKACREPRLSSGQRLLELVHLSAALVLLPAMVYLLTYLPWFYHQGFDLSEWFSVQHLTYLETVAHSGFNPYDLELDHSPSHWFIKPVAYADFIFGEGKPWILLAIPNPFVWLLTIPSVGYLLYRGVKEKKQRYLYLTALFMFSYLPLLLASLTTMPIRMGKDEHPVESFKMLGFAWQSRSAVFKQDPDLQDMVEIFNVMARGVVNQVMATAKGG